MEAKKKKLDELEEDLFIATVLSYEPEFIHHLEKCMDICFVGLKGTFEKKEPANEDEVISFSSAMQAAMEENFSITDKMKKIFTDFHYAIDEVNEKIYFRSSCIIKIFSCYLIQEKKLKFNVDNEIFDFLFYFYYQSDSNCKETAKEIFVDFMVNLFRFIIYRDFLKLIRFFNSDFLLKPNDNHIPIRIALLDSLNLIGELNNSVPNKENIYRIIHAIVGGNEDNVKKYCLSLIGRSSLSQKQITKKHKEFAQRYINEKKL
ncbi:hypothetical protein [Chryseobacterium lathyri]|jgi:hypothetical protein|uniref:Uncharacterized protein n=1 Tax=Chryseobacterium lathyri TaxID=395933 RepID=A0A511YG77_9FLAO|nr:hypothetical protein [Chryseobacterium lathyri]GEN74210.1 hypothetical protein CLA01_42820 [Chryseobacterium lathyri]